MYSRQQTSRPDRRPDQRTTLVDPQTETFRPVALPALAAAVRAATRKSARTSLLATTRSARFEHEDTPLA